MPRFANMLAEGMSDRGHTVNMWSPKARFFNLPFGRLKKWLGYIDQFILFPIEIRSRLKKLPADTLFVFTDQALGPWVPLVSKRPHIIHCHDFLAQRSALGEIVENKVSFTGRIYQQFIRHGYSLGRNFISVSQNTQTDLHRFLQIQPTCSRVVYNGFNQIISPIDALQAKQRLSAQLGIDISAGYILHVGGNDWYKNRSGVIEMFNHWRSLYASHLPLLLIGSKPSQSLLECRDRSGYKKDIYFLSGLRDETVRLAYSGATVFLFPSLAEGFGWPIAEAMASGCPVITTNQPPMTEVAADAGFYISRKPTGQEANEQWLNESAAMIDTIICFSPQQRRMAVEKGLNNAKRFNTKTALDEIEKIYRNVFLSYS